DERPRHARLFGGFRECVDGHRRTVGAVEPPLGLTGLEPDGQNAIVQHAGAFEIRVGSNSGQCVMVRAAPRYENGSERHECQQGSARRPDPGATVWRAGSRPVSWRAKHLLPPGCWIWRECEITGTAVRVTRASPRPSPGW